ncbi:Imm26 family immunity protein [Amycolatopsis sp. CA-230715]|uniref:Imm26 family immunity protein n=1 Tax=Amycolatopsis sp. CA-230715 TaxID=2745196 RepID=UPI001C01FECF|nr:Imm26 family immunity protein [Amycolatopsis sp. CA-230715]
MPGLVVLVPREIGVYNVARLSNDVSVEFYDLTVTEIRPVSEVEIREAIMLFKISVNKRALKSGSWPVVGKLPLTDEEKTVKDILFTQDSLSGKISKYIYDPVTKQSLESPATAEEVADLEAVAVWDPTHVEERLRDHYAGRRNKWVEHFRPK